MNTETVIKDQQVIIENQRKRIAELTEKLDNCTITAIQGDVLLAIEESYYDAIEELQHPSPNENGIKAVLSTDYDKLFSKIMEAVRKQYSPAPPALPEVTVENLLREYVRSLYTATTDPAIPAKGFRLLLPSIQEYVAGEKRMLQHESKLTHEQFSLLKERYRQALVTAAENEKQYKEHNAAVIASKDAEIAALNLRIKAYEEADQAQVNEIEQIGDRVGELQEIRESLERSNIYLQKQLSERKGLQWVKAGERMPQERGIYFVKIKHQNDRTGEDILHSTAIIDGGKWENRDSAYLWYDIVEWLDESTPLPDTREEAIAFEDWAKDTGWRNVPGWGWMKGGGITRECVSEEDLKNRFKTYLSQKQQTNVNRKGND